jgi:hypothetical protein
MSLIMSTANTANLAVLSVNMLSDNMLSDIMPSVVMLGNFVS